MADVFDVLELVKAQVQAGKACEMVQTFQVGYQIVVEVQILELCTK